MKDDYAPLTPTAKPSPSSRSLPRNEPRIWPTFFDKFVGLMERANFKRLSYDGRLACAAIAGGASDWGVNMDVDFSVFERLELFARGDVIGKRTRRRLLNLWRQEEVKLPIYRRLVFIIKLNSHKRLGPHVDTSVVYLKHFKDIPKLDLEMLLPGARVHLPGMQRLQMSGSLLAGLGMALYKVGAEMFLFFQKAMQLALLEGSPLLWAPTAALCGWGYKQYSSYQSTKQTYSILLTESLYYQNLDNNGGVLTRLLDPRGGRAGVPRRCCSVTSVCGARAGAEIGPRNNSTITPRCISKAPRLSRSISRSATRWRSWNDCGWWRSTVLTIGPCRWQRHSNGWTGCGTIILSTTIRSRKTRPFRKLAERARPFPCCVRSASLPPDLERSPAPLRLLRPAWP